MSDVAIILVLLLTNKATEAQTSIIPFNKTSEVNALQNHSFFALQIRQDEATSKTPTATSNGNNLNTTAGSGNLSRPLDNFRAIFTNYSSGNGSKKYDKQDEPVKLDLQEEVTDLTSPENMEDNIDANIPTPLPLVLDGCVETLFRDDKISVKDIHFDMEKHHYIPQQKIKSENRLRIESVSKRDTSNPISLSTKDAWLEKYNNLLKNKYEERRQQHSDPFAVKKTTESLTTTVSTTIGPRLSTTKKNTTEIIRSTRKTINISTTAMTTEKPTSVKVKPITTKVLMKSSKTNVSLDIPVTENNVRSSYAADWFENKERTKIRFGRLPERVTYLVPTLRLEEGFYPFGFMSEFFALIHPFDFPVGLVKDIVWGKFTFPYSFLLSIKVESAFLVVITIFICLALIIPAYLLVVSFLALLAKAGNDDELDTGALFPDCEESSCNDKALVFVTLLMVLICCTLISGMALTNEEAATAASESRNFVNCACHDIAAWLSSAARDLHHSLVPPMDLVLQAYKEDLKNVEPLLGEPIQKAIASESGMDLVLESLTDIMLESEEISSKISTLRDVSLRAGNLASAASDRLKDLARQLDNMKKWCQGKDVPLCDTVNTNSLELKMKFDLILHGQRLLELRPLGIENLTQAITNAKLEIQALPTVITSQTETVREDIINVMAARRETVYRSSRVLSDIARHLTSAAQTAARSIESATIRFQNYDFWRRMLLLVSTVVFTFVMTLILSGMLCGCGHAKGHAKRTIQVSAAWLCLTSLILWSLVSAIFLIAGHAEVYVCHALWDSPQYKMISKLLDRPSPLFAHDEGVFEVMFRDLSNVTIDVSVREVLRECEIDRPAYNVFQLDKILDVNNVTSYFEWDDLQMNLSQLTNALDLGMLQRISSEMSRILNEMQLVSDVNLAHYRTEYNGPVVGKDLPSLSEQLENVAAQVTDLTTSGRLETLASRTQRLHQSSIKPLEQFRADIVFKLTELELQMTPFRRKLNISLSHIHTAQYYIDNQGYIIANKKVTIFVNRLISHVAGWRTHVLTAAGSQVARCRPLFDVYSAARSLLCQRYVASLHGWWVCGLVLGLAWCAVTPLCVSLWRNYRKKSKARNAFIMENTNSAQQETPTTASCESNNWNTPGPPAPPSRDSW